MKKYMFFALTAFALTALLFAGCQNGTAELTEAEDAVKVQATESIIIEPEQLISKDEAEMLMGEPVEDGVKKDNDVVGQKLCFYSAVNEDINGFIQISITQDSFMANPGNMTAESIYLTTREMTADDAVSIEGLGDDAFLATGGYYILYKGYFLSIFSGNTDSAEVLARLEKTGKLALGNLEAAIK